MKLSKNVSITRAGRIMMVAHHSMLGQLGDEIIAGLPTGFKTRHRLVWVMVGVHFKMHVEWALPGYRIGIQTEQLVDANGAPLWGPSFLSRDQKIRRAIGACDLFLDLSAANAPFYDRFDLTEAERAKLRFGPYVFPSEAPPFVPGNEAAVFFGSMNGRRREALDSMGPDTVRELPYGTYGDRLYAEIARSRAVLNLHFADGTYTELPRMLTALQCGKPLMSEPLGPPFVASEHYMTLDAPHADPEPVFRACADFLSPGYSFARFLEENGV